MVVGESQPPAESSFRWLHLDLWDQRSARWIADQSGLPLEVQALFLSRDEHPRVLGSRRAMAIVLPDFQREFDREETERIGALHIAVRPGLMLTGRHHPLHTPDIFRHRAAQADDLNVDKALGLVLGTLADSLVTRTASAMSELLALEDQVLADDRVPDTRALVTLRRLTARLHRMASGMHMTLFRASEDPAVDPTYRGIFESVARRLQPIERDVIAAQTQLRLLREELDLQAGQQTNENVYLLSVITALFMPATLVTGFFGMNTSGLPFTGGIEGTLIATVMAVACSGATWFLLRMMGLIRR